MRSRKNKSILESFRNAMNGIILAFREEPNMKIHTVAAVVVAGLSFLYRLTKEEILIVGLTVAMVILCELFNTAIEHLTDGIYEGYHPRAKAIKDMAAGAVLISAVASALVGFLLFFHRICFSIRELLERIV